jgi:hypothetical protein
MAHADYNCCAICDCKMDYNGGCAETKEAICPDCIERTADLGRLCVRPSQVLEYVKSLDDVAALRWLHGVGFDPCYYGNELDDYLVERGLIEKAGDRKWGKRLRAMPVCIALSHSNGMGSPNENRREAL